MQITFTFLASWSLESSEEKETFIAEIRCWAKNSRVV